MRKIRKLLSIVLVFILVAALSVVGFADNSNGKGNVEVIEADENIDDVDEDEEDIDEEDEDIEEEDEEDVDDEEKEGQPKGKGKGLDKAWKEEKAKLIADKDVVEELKDELEEEKDLLEEEYEKAVAEGNTELAEQLMARIQEVEVERLRLKGEMKGIQEEMKNLIRSRYTEEEMEQIHKVKKEFEEKEKDVEVLPVENIIVKNKDVKFDTPPVIKQNRVLIPVRALTEGFGATVDWDEENGVATITKGDIEIVLTIGSNIALVNGEEVAIDVTSEIYSNRTYVPLRFISESFGLKVEWDDEADVAEIEDDEELEDDTEEEEEAEVTDDTEENVEDEEEIEE